MKREQMRIKHLTCFLKCPIKIADTFWPYFFGIPYKSLNVIPHAIIVADGLMLLTFHSISYIFIFSFGCFDSLFFWFSLRVWHLFVVWKKVYVRVKKITISIIVSVVAVVFMFKYFFWDQNVRSFSKYIYLYIFILTDILKK